MRASYNSPKSPEAVAQGCQAELTRCIGIGYDATNMGRDRQQITALTFGDLGHSDRILAGICMGKDSMATVTREWLSEPGTPPGRPPPRGAFG